MKHPIIASALVLAACGGSTQQVHPVQARAPFDLGCTAEQTRYFPIDENTIGAEGCGQRLTYVRLCREVTSHVGVYASSRDECQWVAD